MWMSLRFITGLFTSSAYGVTYTYVLELLTERRRMLLGVINSITFGIGTMYLSLLAYLFNDWRSLARAIALTPGTSYFIYFVWAKKNDHYLSQPTHITFLFCFRPSTFARVWSWGHLLWTNLFQPTLTIFLKLTTFIKLVLVIPVIISFFTLVESPRWLLNKNKEAEANKGGFLN